MLKEGFKISLIDYLDKNSDFRYSDFEFNETEKTTYSTLYTELTIRFRYENNYYFKLKVPDHKGSSIGSSEKELKFSFEIEYSPGEISNVEKANFGNKEEINRQIIQWIQLFKEDMLKKGINRILDSEIKRQLENIRILDEKMKDMGDEFISKEEAGELINKLQELEEKFILRLENEADKNEELKREIQKMRDEINFLKETVTTIEKKKWFQMLGSRLISWVSNPGNKKYIETGAKIIKHALPEQIKDIFPNNNGN